MRTEQRSTAIRTAVLAGLAIGALLLGGCAATPPASPPESNSTAPEETEETEEQPQGKELTCEEFAGVIEESLPLMFVMFDTDGNAGEAAEAFRTLSDMWSGFTPPAEIANDWPALTTWADEYAAAWEAVPADADLQESYQQISADFEEEDAAYDAAMENVTTYVSEECPAG